MKYIGKQSTNRGKTMWVGFDFNHDYGMYGASYDARDAESECESVARQLVRMSKTVAKLSLKK
jgi:hypothetical protein